MKKHKLCGTYWINKELNSFIKIEHSSLLGHMAGDPNPKIVRIFSGAFLVVYIKGEKYSYDNITPSAGIGEWRLKRDYTQTTKEVWDEQIDLFIKHLKGE